jgi:hypothetical protein
MKYLLCFSLLISLGATAQWKSFIISVRGDTLNRVDLNGKKQGPWVIHVDALRGEEGYDEQGYFQDDKKIELWKKFSLQGDKIAEENYRWGSLDGKSRYFTRTGGLVREESWRAIEPGKSWDTVDIVDPIDPSKVIDRIAVKVEGSTVKHGEWTYYDPEWGTIQKTENYFMDKIKTGAVAGIDDDADLKPIDVGAGKKTISKPKEIMEYEKKNSGKKKVRTRDGSTGQ